MPLRLTPLEWLLERFQLLPMPLLDMPLAPGIAKALTTACELEIFEALNEQSLTLEELAQRLNCHPQGLYPLLQLLRATGYLRSRRGRYSNRRVVRRWLLKNSPLNIAPYIIHSPDIVAIWEHLPEVVRTYQQVVHMPYEDDTARPEVQAALERHYAGLASLAMVLGREVLYRTSLPTTATRLLDVGGSHGAYSSLFCRKYAELHATILDLPPGIEAGKRLVPQWGCSERIDFLCLDMLKEELPAELVASFDVLPDETNARLLERVARCLKPGGLLFYVDQVTDQVHTSHLATAMVQLMALTTGAIGGTCYPFATVKCWLERAGLGQIRQRRLLMPGATLITARKV